MTSLNVDHQPTYKLEAADEQTEHAIDYRAFLSYAQTLAENHPRVFDEMSHLLLTNGRDTHHWQERFQQADASPTYTYAFSQATKELDEEHRAEAAHHTAELLTRPLEAQLNHISAQRLLSESKSESDPLDPESHRLILAYTIEDTTHHMHGLQTSISSALTGVDRQELAQAFHDVAYLIHRLDQADGLPEPEPTYEGLNADILRGLSQHRTDLMDQKFQDHIAAHHPNLEGSSPSDESFQQLFHDFTSEYRTGDKDRLARHYATQAATAAVTPAASNNLIEYRSAWSSRFTDTYTKLAYPPDDDTPQENPTTPNP